MRKSIAFLIALALIFLPIQNSICETPPPPPPRNSTIVACVVAVMVVAVGAVMVVGIKKLCDRLPPLPPPEPPEPPDPTNNVPTNLPPMIRTNLPPRYSLSCLVVPTPSRGPVIFQSSSDFREWQDTWRVEMTVRMSSVEAKIYDSQGQEVMSQTVPLAYGEDGQYYVLLDFTSLPRSQSPPSQQFWRLLSLAE
mgnify:CR=1 FL=1